MLAAALFMADTPAAGDAAKTPAPPAKADPAKTDKPTVVCKTEAVTGSIMTKRVCHTVDKQAQQEERMNLEKIQVH